MESLHGPLKAGLMGLIGVSTGWPSGKCARVPHCLSFRQKLRSYRNGAQMKARPRQVDGTIYDSQLRLESDLSQKPFHETCRIPARELDPL